jgi:hypothetical protein
MIYVQCFMTIGSGIQKFMGEIHIQIRRQQGDLISLLLFCFFQNKESGIRTARSFIRGLLYFYATQETRFIHPEYSLLRQAGMTSLLRFREASHGAESFLRSCQLLSYSRISQKFMEPVGSLPCSQDLSTGPYPEPDQSTPPHPILSL